MRRRTNNIPEPLIRAGAGSTLSTNINASSESLHFVFNDTHERIVPIDSIGCINRLQDSVFIYSISGKQMLSLEGNIARAFWEYVHEQTSITFLDKPEEWELDLTQFSIMELRHLATALAGIHPMNEQEQAILGIEIWEHLLKITAIEHAKLLRRVAEALACHLEQNAKQAAN